MNDPLLLVLSTIATYRLTILIAKDLGPYRIFEKIRHFLSRKAKTNPKVRKSAVHVGIECVWCVSIWMAIPISAIVMFFDQLPHLVQFTFRGFILMLTMSAISMALNKLFTSDK